MVSGDSKTIVVTAIAFFSSFVGGMFYTLGLLASDFQRVGQYQQSSINLAVGLCYMAGMVVQLPLNGLVSKAPVLSACVSWSLATLGWAGLMFVSFYSPLPLVALVVPICFVGIGIGLSVPPTFAVLASYFDASSVRYRRIVTIFVATYALSACLAGIVYQFAIPTRLSLNKKLAAFCAAQAALCFLLTAVGVFFLRANHRTAVPSDGESATDPGAANEPLPAVTIEQTITAIVKSPLTWIMLAVSCINYGVSINFYSNSGAMLYSIAEGDASKYLFVIFITFGVGQLIGRLACGEIMSRLTTAGRVWEDKQGYALVLLQTASSLALLIVSACSAVYNNVASFFIYNTLNALAYGVLWALVFDMANANTFFGDHGAADFFILYGFFMLAPGIGPMVLDPISGWLYDMHADKHSHVCYGLRCYRNYNFVTCGLLAICLALAAVATHLFKKRYSRARAGERSPLLHGGVN